MIKKTLNNPVIFLEIFMYYNLKLSGNTLF